MFISNFKASNILIYEKYCASLVDIPFWRSQKYPLDLLSTLRIAFMEMLH